MRLAEPEMTAIKQRKYLDKVIKDAETRRKHQSVAKSDKIKLLNEPKQTELVKQNMVSTQCTMCDL